MTTESKPTSVPYSPDRVKNVAGRWALLENGDRVTAIPEFITLTLDDWNARVEAFQADPDEYLRTHPRVQTILPWRSSRV